MPSPIPKPAAVRQRRNKAVTRSLLPAVPMTLSHQLPERSDGEAWRQEAIDLWRLAWASPMAAEFMDSDVPGLLLIADLTHRYWTTGNFKVAAELRLQRREYGLAPLARRSLQWEVAKVKEAVTRAQEPTKPRVVKDPRSVLHSVG